MAYGSLFTGKPEEIRQLPTLTPLQIGSQNQALQQASTGLQNLNLSFDPIAAEARRNFQTQTIPTLLERFQSSQGSGNPFSNSAIGGQLASAGQDFEGKLAAMKAQYGLSQHDALLRQLGLGLKPQFETAISPETGGLWGQTAQGFGQAIPLMALLSSYGKQQGTQSSTGPTTEEQGFKSYIPYLLKILGGAAGGFFAGGPAGAAVGAGSQFLGGR